MQNLNKLSHSAFNISSFELVWEFPIEKHKSNRNITVNTSTNIICLVTYSELQREYITQHLQASLLIFCDQNKGNQGVDCFDREVIFWVCLPSASYSRILLTVFVGRLRDLQIEISSAKTIYCIHVWVCFGNYDFQRDY